MDGIAKWVDEQFFAPFGSDKDGSPFKGSLVISDASLGNETVLESYLASKPIAPEKVLVSSSSGSHPFKLACTSFCVGPFWLEDWSAVRKDEIFSFGKSQSGMKSAETRLKNQLIVIHRDEGLPSALRRSARDLRQILDRDQSDENREFSTVKSLDSKATWLTLPLNYPQFFRPHAEDDGEQKVVREAEEWQRGLAGAFQVAGTVIPVIPHYKEFPWAACLGVSDPSRFRQVFDDRYFMASTELNLLNTILLAESEGKEGEAPTP